MIVPAYAEDSAMDEDFRISSAEEPHMDFRSPMYTTDSYSVYYKTGMSTPWSTLANYLNTAETALENQFDIYLTRLYASSSSNLTPRSGCPIGVNAICSSYCAENDLCKTLHHKSANHFLYQSEAGDAKIFRFVDYVLCWYSGSGHGEVYGLASGDDSDIIVTLKASNIQRTVVHEFSHWYGAYDNRCTSDLCVMKRGSNVYNRWCSRCKEDIEDYLLGFTS